MFTTFFNKYSLISFTGTFILYKITDTNHAEIFFIQLNLLFTFLIKTYPRKNLHVPPIPLGMRIVHELTNPTQSTKPRYLEQILPRTIYFDVLS